jgi:DNA-binding NarL/FixJ family response regulator
MNRRELLKALSAIPLLPMILNGRKARAHGTTINPARKPQQQVRLVIVDDHPIFREGLGRLLEAQPDYKVIGEGSDGAEAVQVVRQLKPDILLLDDVMPKHSGFEALRELSNPANPTPVRVILLTVHDESRHIVEALQLGARGIVFKYHATEVLFKAIQAVMADEYWINREQVSNLAQYLLKWMMRDEEARQQRRQKNFGLTPRELEIVSAVVAGYSNKEMARYFCVPDYTVKYSLRNIFDKLGVSSRLELALFAVNQGLPIRPIV